MSDQMEQAIIIWTLKGYVKSIKTDLGWTEKKEIKLVKDQWTACIYYNTPFTGITGIIEEHLDGAQTLGQTGFEFEKLLEVFS